MTTPDNIATSSSTSPHGAADPSMRDSAALPNQAYVEHSEWLKERDLVIAKTWAGLGFSRDISQPGSVYPVVFMGLPLVMVRDCMVKRASQRVSTSRHAVRRGVG